MARVLLLAVVLALYPHHSVLAADQSSCEVAGADAERDWRLPPGLLAAIGRIESGRYDPATGRVSAWPFTINAAGEGHYFDSSTDAIRAVQDLVMRGVQSIDVGCFQINLMYHPGAFSTLDQAFDVRANADYAARFLSDLHDRTGSWEAAIAWYHSATPSEGEPYRNRVLADWQGGGLRIAPAIPAQWAMRAGPATDPVVVLISTSAQQVRVFTPAVYTAASATNVSSAAPTTVARAAVADAYAPVHRWSSGGRLPRIITPRG